MRTILNNSFNIRLLKAVQYINIRASIVKKARNRMLMVNTWTVRHFKNDPDKIYEQVAIGVVNKRL